MKQPQQRTKKTSSNRGKEVTQSLKASSASRRSGPIHSQQRPKQKPHKAPRTVGALSAMSEHAQDQWTLVTHVIQKMRSEGTSVTQAAKEYGIDRRKVIELGGSALRKQRNGRYRAKPVDRLLRVLVIPSKEGPKEVAVRDSRTASKLGSYSAAVQRFLQTGDKSKLSEFRKLRLKTADGKPFKLLTDPKELTRLGHAGELRFESLYARVA